MTEQELTPRCPKQDCSGTEFVGIEKLTPGVSFPITFVVCKKCGTVVGIVPDKELETIRYELP